MVTTLVGAFFGGWLAGYLPGSLRRDIALAHGFLAWALAFVVAFAFQLVVLRGALVTATNALADAAAVSSTEVAPMTPGEPGLVEPGRPAPPSMRGQTLTPSTPAREDLAYAGRVALDYLRGAGWSWFGTWFLAGIAALAGASVAARRLRLPPREEYEEPVAEGEGPVPPTTPMTPAPSA
jgi:hypothetical protein